MYRSHAHILDDNVGTSRRLVPATEDPILFIKAHHDYIVCSAPVLDVHYSPSNEMCVCCCGCVFLIPKASTLHVPRLHHRRQVNPRWTTNQPETFPLGGQFNCTAASQPDSFQLWPLRGRLLYLTGSQSTSSSTERDRPFLLDQIPKQ